MIVLKPRSEGVTMMMASPLLPIAPKDRTDEWMTIDMRDEIGSAVVIPCFGPDHNAGLDCWCLPDKLDGVIVHNECH